MPHKNQPKKIRKDGEPDGRSKNGGVGNVGRKPVPEHEKKVAVSFYQRQEDIDILGGKEEVREIAQAAIVTELSKKKRIKKRFGN